MGQVNKTLIREKSDTVVRCISRVRSKLTNNQNEFLADVDAQDIVCLNIERAVQSCVDIAAHIISYNNLPSSGSMASAFQVLSDSGIITLENALKIKKAVGLRNLLVHQYKQTDWNIVWTVSKHRLIDLLDFIKQILNWMDAQK